MHICLGSRVVVCNPGGPIRPGRRGFTRQPESPNKCAHFRVPAFENTTKIQRKDPQERERRMKIVAGGGKKRAKFWAVRQGPAKGCPAEVGFPEGVQRKGHSEMEGTKTETEQKQNEERDENEQEKSFEEK